MVAKYHFPLKGTEIITERNISRSEVENVHMRLGHLVLEGKEAFRNPWVMPKGHRNKKKGLSWPKMREFRAFVRLLMK